MKSDRYIPGMPGIAWTSRKVRDVLPTFGLGALTIAALASYVAIEAVPDDAPVLG